MHFKQLSFILILVVFFAACDFKTAEYYLSAAESLSDKGEYLEANKLLDKAIEKNNQYWGAYINRGANKSLLNDFEGAIEDYQIVLKSDKKNTLALFNIANNYKRLEEYQKAVDYYNEAFNSKGGQELYINYHQNDFLNLYESDVPGHEINYERGIAYYYLGNLEEAFNDFSSSISKNYLPEECYYWIGFIYVTTGQLDLACENFTLSKQFGNKDAESALKKYCKN